jgi:malate dehydrogenase (oxaloacetate-decarboxylating)
MHRKRKTLGEHSLSEHLRFRGKIEIALKAPLRTRDDLSLWYTPGVGAVSTFLSRKPREAGAYTMKGNSVAVISDGSAVLGLGNIGPFGALPVMEGKAMIFKAFAGIDAFPIVLGTQEPMEVVQAIEQIAPTFGGINLEDIAAPHCFFIEQELKKRLSIPVMHDDQHGTAIVVLAGLMNAFRVAKKNIKHSRIVIAGAGAAGTAITKLLLKYGVSELLVLDRRGILGRHRKDLEGHKRELARLTNRNDIHGDSGRALHEADAVVGVSGPGTISEKALRGMEERSIVFALANPVPEIMPDRAKHAGAFIIASGRSDFPNQVNNALVFPGIFRGALDRKVRQITDEMKLRAAHALAMVVKKPTPAFIVPSIFDKKVVKAVAGAIR